VRGRLFREGAEGVTVDAAVSGGELTLSGPDVSRRWPLDALEVTLGGTDDAHLTLTPRATPGEVLYLERAGLVAALEAGAAPPWFVDQVRGLVAASRRRWAGARTLLLSIVAALLLAAGLLVVEARALALRSIPLEWEVAAGDAAWDSYRASATVLDDGELQAFVEETGRRLLAAGPGPAPYELRFHVVRDPTVNAFAFPGGVIVVNTGLLTAAATPDEVAGVLAHELAHVLRRHSLEAALDQVGLLVALGLLVDSGASFLELQTALSLLDLKFSRDHERDADTVGLALLHAAGLDPAAMGTFFERLARESEALPEALTLLTTHPASQERAEALAERAAKLPAAERRPLVTPERWAELQARAR
jgi:predicted Zn-dependent protease